ncbi:cupin domain-containing protein [Rhizobiaceae bacterium]|nr:cupin domain-containing protein [Rhizobiaceae bacterium]
MSHFQMTLRRIALHGPAVLTGSETSCHAVHALDGEAVVNGVGLAVGEGVFAAGETTVDGRASILHFLVERTGSPHAAGPGEVVLEAAFDFGERQALIRLDQVSFPPGARAYRHIHPGPGIRYLTAGRLEIASDHDITVMEAGDAWFEEALSPVQATAADVPHTSFIRLLVLPAAFEGKSTISLLDPKDEALPKLQTNTRFFDRIVHWPSSARSASDR